MPKNQKRHKTKYPGVYYLEVKRAKGGTEKVYYVVFKKDGKVYEEKAGKQYQDDMTPARASSYRAQRLEGKRASRKAIREEKKAEAKKPTIDYLWQQYYKAHFKNASMKDDVSRYKNYIKSAIGKKEPCCLVPLDVERIRKNLSGKKPQTVKHVLQLLRKIIFYGVDIQLCTGPGFKIKVPKVDNLKTEDLSPVQLKNLLAAMEADHNKEIVAIMKLAMFTGMRRGELLKLEWSDIDFDRGFIFIRDPKGGKSQHIPMNDAAQAVLKSINQSGVLVFPSRKGGAVKTNISRGLNRIKKAAGLPEDFRPLHGLRHYFATNLANSGQVDMYILQRLLTQKDPRMTQRYAHLRDESLKQAANVAGEMIGKAIKQNDKVLAIVKPVS